MPPADQTYTLTDEDLVAAGFKMFRPNTRVGDNWDAGFQYRVRDGEGIRYFVNVRKWDHTKYGYPVGWDVEVVYNEGCLWWGEGMWLKSRCTNKTPAEILFWAAQLWIRLSPTYHEKSS